MAADRTLPNGRVVGIDVIPAQPPKGVSTIQGNFLSQAVQDEVKKYLRESDRGRARNERSFIAASDDDQMTEEDLDKRSTSYLELEKRAESNTRFEKNGAVWMERQSQAEGMREEEKMVDVVLSDMSEPWAQTDGFWKRSLSDPYFRMMNASGNPFRDHAGSMVRLTPAYQWTPLILDDFRIFAMLHYNSPLTPSIQGVTSSANSIKAEKTRLLSTDSKASSPRCTGKSPVRPEVYVVLQNRFFCLT